MAGQNRSCAKKSDDFNGQQKSGRNFHHALEKYGFSSAWSTLLPIENSNFQRHFSETQRIYLRHPPSKSLALDKKFENLAESRITKSLITP